MSNLEIFVHTACAMVVIIVTARSVGTVMVRLKQPRVVGEMIAGVILGPTFFSTAFPEIAGYLFKDTQTNIYILGNLGLSLYMFLVGADIDLSNVDKSIRKQAAWLSVVAVIIPFAAGGFCAWTFYEKLCLPGIPLPVFMLFTGTAFSIMAFPMLARILDEQNLIQTRFGSLALLSSSIQDVVTWILLAFVIAVASTGTTTGGLITLGGALIFIGIVMIRMKPLFKKIGTQVQEKGSMTQGQFAVLVVALLIAAIITDKVGLYSVFGGFILGLAMPRDPMFQKELKSKMMDITIVMILPLFFAFSGLKTNFLQLAGAEMFVPCLVILGLSIISKYLPILLTMKACGYSWREASAIGGLCNARGLMELIVANIGLDYKIIDVNMYSIMILIAVITTLGGMPIYNASLGKQKML
ncbi:MAG: cation:proton antiporter [Bacteroidia bacterium]